MGILLLGAVGQCRPIALSLSFSLPLFDSLSFHRAGRSDPWLSLASSCRTSNSTGNRIDIVCSAQVMFAFSCCSCWPCCVCELATKLGVQGHGPSRSSSAPCAYAHCDDDSGQPCGWNAWNQHSFVFSSCSLLGLPGRCCGGGRFRVLSRPRPVVAVSPAVAVDVEESKVGLQSFRVTCPWMTACTRRRYKEKQSCSQSLLVPKTQGCNQGVVKYREVTRH